MFKQLPFRLINFTLIFAILITSIPYGFADDFVPIGEESGIDNSYFILDSTNLASDAIILQFGSLLNKTLEFNLLGDIFKFNDSLEIGGDLTLSGKINGVDINLLESEFNTHSGSTANPHQTTLEQTRSQNNQISGDLDFNQNQAQNLAIGGLAAAPASPVEGQIYYNLSNKTTYIWNGSLWESIISGVSGSGGSVMSAVQVRRTSNYTPPTINTWYDFTFDTTDVETNPLSIEHDSVNTDNILIKEDGLYKISYQIDNLATVNHQLETRVNLNDTTPLNWSHLINYDYQQEHVPHSANFLAQLVAGDFITFQVLRTTTADVINETTMTVVKMETGLQGAQGIAGPQGAQGEQGLPGDPGPSTTSDSYIIDSDDNGNPQILSFGSALNKTLYFDRTNDYFVLTDRLNIGLSGTLDGLKITTTASATDNDQNQIEVRNNAWAPVFGVDEDGDINASGGMTINGALNFNQNQAQNLVIENLAAAPLTPALGQIYYNTTDLMTYLWDGTTWLEVTPGKISLSGLQARRTTGFTLAALSTWYDIDLETTDIQNNTDSLEHNAILRDNINIKEEGLYQIHYRVTANDATVAHGLSARVRKNDTTVINGSLLSNQDGTNEYTAINATFIAQLAPGDFLTLQASRSTANAIINETVFAIVKLDGSQGTQGPIGPQGPQGIPGDPGPSTASDSYVIDSDDSANLKVLSFGPTLNNTIVFDKINGWFNFSHRMNIGGNGNANGVKFTTRAGPLDLYQNQIEVRNNANTTVFGVDEQGNISTNGGINMKGKLNLNQNEIQNMAFEKLAVAPALPVKGQIYFNTTDNKTYIWDGVIWQNIFSETGTVMTALQVRRLANFTMAVLNTWYDMPFEVTDLETKTTALSLNTTNKDNININETGLYRITYHVDSSDPTVKHEIQTQVRVNDITVLNGSLLINRDYQDEHIPSSASFLAMLNAGDFITLQAQRLTAGEILANASMTVVKMETGAKGEKWDKGDPGEDGADGLPGGFIQNVFFAYDSVGGQSLTTTPVTLNLNTSVVTDSNYTLAANEITINTTALYKITTNVTASNPSTTRTRFNVRIQENTSGTYANIPYAIAGNEMRETTTNGSATTSIFRTLTAGTKIRVQVATTDGTNGVNTVANGSNLSIEFIR